MVDIDVLEINNGGDLVLRDNRIPLNLTNAMLAVGADGNVLTGESYSRAGLYFNLHLYIFGTEITSYADITDELATKLIGSPCYIDLDTTGQGHGVGFISHIRKTDDTWTIVAYDIKGAKNNAASSFTFGIEVKESMTVYTFSNNDIIDDARTTSYTTWSSTKINDVFATKDDLPNTATINDVVIASFTDGAGGLPVKSLIVDITSSQSGSGDPSPSNPRAINGFNSVTVGTVNNTANAEYFDGLLKGTHVAVELSFYNWTENASYDNVFNTPTISATYTTYDRESLISDMYSVYTSSDVMNHDYGIAIAASRRQFYVKNKDYSTAADFKTAMTGHYIIFKLATPITPTITKAEYEAVCAAFGYTGTTATTALGGTYYGGYLNVTTGLLTVTHGYVDLASLSYTTTSWGAYRTSAPSDCKLQASTVVPDAMAEKYKITTYSNLNNNKPNNNMAIGSGSSPYFYFIADSTPTGLVMYERKDTDYETIQLTPAQLKLLQGKNNIFANSGNINTLVYFKDGEAIITINDLIEADIADKADKSDLPTKTSDLNNDSDYQTGTQVATTVSTKENVIPRLTGTLLAGQTSITISDASIVDGSLLEYFVSDPSVMILSANPTVGSVTLTFEAQASDLVVGVVVL